MAREGGPPRWSGEEGIWCVHIKFGTTQTGWPAFAGHDNDRGFSLPGFRLLFAQKADAPAPDECRPFEILYQMNRHILPSHDHHLLRDREQIVPRIVDHQARREG